MAVARDSSLGALPPSAPLPLVFQTDAPLLSPAECDLIIGEGAAHVRAYAQRAHAASMRWLRAATADTVYEGWRALAADKQAKGQRGTSRACASSIAGGGKPQEPWRAHAYASKRRRSKRFDSLDIRS